jgi:hypothetical protein
MSSTSLITLYLQLLSWWQDLLSQSIQSSEAHWTQNQEGALWENWGGGGDKKLNDSKDLLQNMEILADVHNADLGQCYVCKSTAHTQTSGPSVIQLYCPYYILFNYGYSLKCNPLKQWTTTFPTDYVVHNVKTCKSGTSVHTQIKFILFYTYNYTTCILTHCFYICSILSHYSFCGSTSWGGAVHLKFGDE